MKASSPPPLKRMTWVESQRWTDYYFMRNQSHKYASGEDYPILKANNIKRTHLIDKP